MKWRLKSCPRCGGDIMIYVDFDGWHETCLQCGYSVELENINVADYVTAESSSADPEMSVYKTVQNEYTREVN
jgi:DNA-directed RNA polymerase subunit M/transcription elongation factor TFIIS